MADARKAKMRARLQQKSRAMNLKYAADSLRRDRKVVITACLNHPGSLIYCLDEKLRTELTGLSRKQLQDLLETADEDMLTKEEAPKSQEQKDFEELDFEAVLRQEKADGLLFAAGGGGRERPLFPHEEAALSRHDSGIVAEPEPEPSPVSENEELAAKRAEIAAKVVAARAAQEEQAAAATHAAQDDATTGAADRDRDRDRDREEAERRWPQIEDA